MNSIDLKEFNTRMSEIDKFMGEMRAESLNRRETLLRLEEDFQEMREQQRKTIDKVDGLQNKISRWEGKLGGFVFIVSCLMAFFGAFKDQILAFIKG